MEELTVRGEVRMFKSLQQGRRFGRKKNFV